MPFLKPPNGDHHSSVRHALAERFSGWTVLFVASVRYHPPGSVRLPVIWPGYGASYHPPPRARPPLPLSCFATGREPGAGADSSPTGWTVWLGWGLPIPVRMQLPHQHAILGPPNAILGLLNANLAVFSTVFTQINIIKYQWLSENRGIMYIHANLAS